LKCVEILQDGKMLLLKPMCAMFT